MIERLGKERLVEMLLAGTPDRLIDAMTAASPEDQADLASFRETLAELASAAAVRPPPSLRERVLGAKAKPKRPSRPVFVVLDMIRDYLEPGGPLEVPRAREIVPALRARLDAARAASMPIVFVCDSHEPGDPELDLWSTHAVSGTGGDEVWPDLAPKPGEHVVKKRTYSAFTGSELGPLLDGLGADQIVLTGCATEVGLTATAYDALQRGFVVTIPPDSQAGGSFAAEMVSLITLSAMVPFEPRYLRRETAGAAG